MTTPRRNGRSRLHAARAHQRKGGRAADNEEQFGETEEVLEVLSVADSSEGRSSGGSVESVQQVGSSSSSFAHSSYNSKLHKGPISISSSSVPASLYGGLQDGEGDDMDAFEEIDVNHADGGDDMEEVDVEDDQAGDVTQLNKYESAYLQGADVGQTSAQGIEQDQSAVPIYHDGKGQHKGVQITMQAVQKAQAAAKKSKASLITPRDRADRLAAHKLHVLALLAFAKKRNKLLDDDRVRDQLATVIPARLTNKMRAIKPKKVASVTERVRMTEDLVDELVRWWGGRFRLDRLKVVMNALRQPNADVLAGSIPPPGSMVDGWEVESPAERDERQKEERRGRAKAMKEVEAAEDARVAQASARVKGKGKAKEPDELAEQAAPIVPPKSTEICLFAPGSTQPIYMRLLTPTEPIVTPEDLLQSAVNLTGSRELSAQLFVALCRTMGLPARLVISLQVVPWSISASKISLTSTKPPPPPVAPGKRSAVLAKLSNRTTRDQHKPRQAASKEVQRNISKDKEEQRSMSKDTPSSDNDDDVFESPSAPTARRQASKRRAAKNVVDAGTMQTPIDVDGDDIDTASASASTSKPKKGARKAKEVSEEKPDNRPEKWRGLTKALEVEHKPRLRAYKTKARDPNEVALDDLSDVEAVDMRSPPTMWAEVFNKPLKKWMTVDPIRCEVMTTGNRRMEPSASDRTNKLVYVVAFEEDGTARDVTARYTRTLATRIARMRPPAAKRGGCADWWADVVRAIARKTPLDRDAEEDVELEDFASRESLPSSVGAFKDHPVYVLERHLLRDEVLFPPTRVGTFQGGPVYSRKNVVKVRSARQWYNEGRVVRENQTALKRVKARGFTLESKRASEQAKADGAEGVMEGLYADFQTQLYEAPPVVDGVVPKNAYGNIDLFVPSMLPKGAVHLPYSGTAKVAAKLGVSYAEATVGFEFRKRSSHPKMAGIVIPEEHEDVVTEAYWATAEAAAQREFDKKQERALRNWKKLLNGLRIAKRLRDEYGAKSAAVTAKLKMDQPLAEGPSRLRKDDQMEVDDDDDDGGGVGGFVPEGAEERDEGETGPFNAITSRFGRNSRAALSRRRDGAATDSETNASNSSSEDVRAAGSGPQSILPPPLRRTTARLPVVSTSRAVPSLTTETIPAAATAKRRGSGGRAAAPVRSSRRPTAARRSTTSSRRRARGQEETDDDDTDDPKMLSTPAPQRRSTRTRAFASGEKRKYVEAGSEVEEEEEGKGEEEEEDDAGFGERENAEEAAQQRQVQQTPNGRTKRPRIVVSIGKRT